MDVYIVYLWKPGIIRFTIWYIGYSPKLFVYYIDLFCMLHVLSNEHSYSLGDCCIKVFSYIATYCRFSNIVVYLIAFLGLYFYISA